MTFISNQSFLTKIPTLNPLTREYIEFWRTEKRRCIEGMWVGNKFMPGVLYFYTNYFQIELNKSKNSKQKIIASPHLRDLEWIWGYMFLVARGFSGFENGPEIPQDKLMDYLQNGSNFPHQLGRPLYHHGAMNMIEIGSRGNGKDLEENTLVYKKEGPVKIKDINPGDYIYGADGKLTRVLNKVNYKDQLQYQVSFSDGRSIECGGGHLWTLRTTSQKTVTRSIDDIKNNYLGYLRPHGKRDPKYFVKYCEPIQYEEKKQELEPYYLGLWLGDGNAHNTGITTTDPEIIEYVYTIADKENLHITLNQNGSKNCPTYNINAPKNSQFNVLKNKLKKLNLIKNKHIPYDYLYGSIEQRMELLKGLMDSDGYSGLTQVEFTTTIPQLAKDFYNLVNSLGIGCKVYTKQVKGYKLVYRFGLKPKIPIFKLKRKQRYWKNECFYKTCKISKTGIANITPTSIKPSVCIEVDNEDKLFVAGDYIVTHNSFRAAGGGDYNFLFDGQTEYDPDQRTKSETLISAIDTKYSSALLQKMQLGLDNLKGEITFNGREYPSPFKKLYSGSWDSGKAIKALYDYKQGNNWVKKGSGSSILHRSFQANPLAANGSRPSYAVIDEVGFCYNLLEVHGQLREAVANGSEQFGTLHYTGTGGAMATGATEAAQKIFYSPEAFNCIAFDDKYENRGKIGYFIPATLGLNAFKNEEGITDEVAALNYLMKEREKLAEGKNREPLYSELQNRPLKPSEAFLTITGNVFPVVELKEHLANLKSIRDDKLLGVEGKLIQLPNGEVKFEPYPLPSNRALKFPIYEKDEKEGCVTIWEQPIPNPPFGLYTIGLDPYAMDQASTSNSVGSMIVYKRFISADKTSNCVVAEYTGRPELEKDFLENARKLALFYNGRILFENEKPGLKMYLENKNSLYLLYPQPQIIKSLSPNSKVDRKYGIHMSTQIKGQLEIMTRDWLKTELSPGVLQLTNIPSIPLVEELIAYDGEVNTDRVIAFFLALLMATDMHRVVVHEAQKEALVDNFFKKKLFI